MAKPKISKWSKKQLRDAARIQRLLANQKDRVLLVAEALQRVDAFDMYGTPPGEVSVKKLDDHQVGEAISLVSEGGLYRAYRDAPKDSEEKSRLESVIDVLGDACQAYSCTVQRVCRDRKGRFATKACDEAIPERINIGDAVSWKGNTTEIFVEDATLSSLQGYYALVPVDALVPSHDPFRGFEPSPGYPPELQERDYRAQTEREKVLTASRGFEPKLLISDNDDPTTGPPIIDQHGWVLGGNGRTMILQLHVARDGAAYQKQLKKELGCNACYGLLGAPVEDHALVRVLEGDYDRRKVSNLLNTTMTTELGREEAAVSLGNRIPDPVLDRLADELSEASGFAGAVDSMGSELVKDLIRAGVITQSTRTQWLRSVQGKLLPKLNRAGKDRLKDALIGALIDDPDALRHSPPILLRWYEYVAPRALPLDRWDPENGTGYNWVPVLRAIAGELARSVLLTEGELIQRYGAGELFDETSDPNVDRLMEVGPEGAQMLLWVRANVKRPRVSSNMVRDYYKAIPPEVRTKGQAFLAPRSPEELADEGLLPEQLKVSQMEMVRLAEIEAAGGTRRFLTGHRFEGDLEDEDQDLDANWWPGPDAGGDEGQTPSMFGDAAEDEDGPEEYSEDSSGRLERFRAASEEVARAREKGKLIEESSEELRDALSDLEYEEELDERVIRIVEATTGLTWTDFYEELQDPEPAYKSSAAPKVEQEADPYRAPQDEEDRRRWTVNGRKRLLRLKKLGKATYASLRDELGIYTPEQLGWWLDEEQEETRDGKTKARAEWLRGISGVGPRRVQSWRNQLVHRGIPIGGPLVTEDEILLGGEADDLPDDTFDEDSLVEGMSVELEHTDDPRKAKEIAKDHLAERGDYYELLEELEMEPEEPQERLHMGDVVDISSRESVQTPAPGQLPAVETTLGWQMGGASDLTDQQRGRIADRLEASSERLRNVIREKETPTFGGELSDRQKSKLRRELAADAEHLEEVRCAMQAIADRTRAGTLPHSLRCISTRAQVEAILKKPSIPILNFHREEIEALLDWTKGSRGTGDARKAIQKDLRRSERGDRPWRLTLRSDNLPAIETLLRSAWKKAKRKKEEAPVSVLRHIGDVVSSYKKIARACIENELQYAQAQRDLERLCSEGEP